MALRLRLFGPFEVAPAGPTSRKAQWLLALMALRKGGALERAWLAGTLWPDASDGA
jgi:DNA-binding SARP family transcriptional activator